MEHMTTVGDAMRSPGDTVTPRTPAAEVWRRLEGGTVRSLIVVEADRVVGVVRWRDLEPSSPPPNSPLTAADLMRRDTPPITPDMTLAAARAVAPDDLGVIPVVDATGRLVGELPSEALIAQDDRRPAAEGPTATPEADEPERVLNIHAGMAVHGSNGHHIGTVSDVVTDGDGRITHLDVKHGAIIKHTKRLPISLVSRVAGETVILSATGDDIDRLPNLDEDT